MIYLLLGAGIVTLFLIMNWGLSAVGDYPPASTRLRAEAAFIGVLITFLFGISILIDEGLNR